MDYNIADAELPTMIVRYDNRLILRSVITGQHLEDLGRAPIWNDVQLTAAQIEQQQHLQAEHNKILEELVTFFPCVDLSKLSTQLQQPTPTIPATSQQQPMQSKQPRQTTKLLQQLALQRARQKSPVNVVDLPPCKVQRNYCCNVCNYCTQNPRSHLLHQRHVHGIRLSIHCCQHCQYASRYFQKLKRHVKMVHTNNGGSPRSANGRRKRVPKPKQNFPNQLPKTNEGVPPPQPTTSQVTPSTPALTNATPTTSLNTKPTTKPTTFTNPEAFFEAAYRNQLLQQQMQLQRLKDFTNARKAVYERKLQSPKTAISTTISQKNKENLNPAKTTLPKIISNEFKEHEKKRIYNCRKCSYMTHIKSRYNKHVKYHSMPMIQCDKCEFRTTYKWNLTRHLRSHHGNGLYKCSVCSFSAHMKQSLTSHEMNHHLPPVGHASRSNKIYRRRRCRVGGSDLALEASIKGNQNLPISKVTELMPPKTADDKDHAADESLLSSITFAANNQQEFKQEDLEFESESSYISSQTSQSIDSEMSSALEQINEKSFEQQTKSDIIINKEDPTPVKTEHNTPITANNLTTSCSSSSISSSSSSSSSASSCTTSSFDAEAAALGLATENLLPSMPGELLDTKYNQTEKFPKTPKEATQAPNDNFQKPELLSPNSSTDDSDDDSVSTVSADETVPDGLHIAYESSPPTSHKSVSSASALSTDWSSFDNDEVNNFTGFE